MKYPVIITALLISPLGYANCLGGVNEYVTSKQLVSSHKVTTQVSGKLVQLESTNPNTQLNLNSEKIKTTPSDEACFYDQKTKSLVLNYAHDKYQLTTTHKEVLAQYLPLVHDKSQIFIEGHADSTGTKQYNKGLSARRAKEVANYLKHNLKQGNRIVEKAFGESAPICQVEQNLATGCNRRVVLTVKQ
ncbi:OmpA family protein [Vibrio sp. TRT 17S01]|uniref:OmpA family protein n=2 Tax=unclassified Vibrio TaxID=2614977 RepID=UPI003CF44C3E